MSGLVVYLCAHPLPISADEASQIPEWPYEREERLRAVESEILDVQRKLFSAKMTNDDEKRADLEKQMQGLEKEQVKLLRAKGEFRPR
jgi:hypothetical protein